MRQAIISDLHSNLEALTACVEHARTQGATHFVCLGDCVGYGADPVPTLDLLMALPHLLLIRGNHDEALFLDEVPDMPGLRQSIDWTCMQLSPKHCELLENAPLVQTLGEATYAHASAHNPQAWDYLRRAEQVLDCLAATSTRVTFIGHVHVPMIFYQTASGSLREFNPEPGVAVPLSPACRYVVNVGSVGQPRDGNNAASYVIYDSEPAAVTIHRVPYDFVSAAQKILDAGLNARYAERLVEGQ